MKKPLVSIIIPIYKVEKYLDRCIKTILDQAYNNLEIILVDDGSPDNCPQMCDEWAKKDSRIKVIHKENGGVSSSRNMGLDASTGEYISFIDPDDIIHPNYYEILMSQIGNADCIICGFKKFTNEIEFENRYNCIAETMTSIEAIKKGFFNNSDIFYVVWNKIIKSDVAKKQRFDEKMKNGEDSLFAFNVIRNCNSVIYLDVDLYGYYMRNDGAVNSIDIKGRKDKLKASRYMYYECMLIDNSIAQKAKTNYFWQIVNNYSKVTCKKERKLLSEEKNFALSNLKILFSDNKTSIKGKIITVLVLLK